MQLKRLGWVTKFDEKWVPKWSQKVIKIEPLGAMVQFFEILCGFERMCFLMSFCSAKRRPEIVIVSEFGREKNVWIICLEGSAGEAVCRGGEREGVKLLEFEDCQRAFS